ncbi:MAG: sugar nucleotide-binding protein [Chloroflexi bacterium]|nr:sugar nucleotide-binding protein [Chloroflexota bacterium]
MSGHARRVEDLEAFAALGVRTLRYPILWERIAPDRPADADWSWSDERLARLRGLGIAPIVGLVHHGSGPRYTSLIDPGFADGLAAFAGAVARRYPWVDRWTPVNEPLTTARFSGLYGHWYPHGSDALTFARALLHQCRGIVLAMRAIRAVNSAAQLVQTDDLGKTYSTRALAYQADFENERRWLSFDLLCGRVDRAHPMWDFLTGVGVAEGDVGWFLQNPCPPDVIGINYYATSERFLDPRCERYPVGNRGGNWREPYADVEAALVRASGLAGVYGLLGEAWERYHLPLAVTESHLGCSRDEQLRWLLEAWDAAQARRREGVDVRAVTAWALLGSYDWDRLLTAPHGYYEPGAFDVRAPSPRRTALAALIADLAAGREPDHPVLATPGWWRRPSRLRYPAIRRHADEPAPTRRFHPRKRWARPLAITGARGTLGRAFARICEVRGLPHLALSRQDLDIAKPESVAAVLDRLQPWAVVNAAGYVRVDDAEGEPAACFRENRDGPIVLAAACAARGIQLVTFSTDLVFDGGRRLPYVESDAVAPLGVYGSSKAQAERRVLERMPSALVVRTSAFFGPWDEYNFVSLALRALATGGTFVAAADQVVSPTYVPDLVDGSLDLLIDGERGIWHLANRGARSWAEFARGAAELAGLDPGGVEARPTASLGLVARRPPYSALGSERGWILPSLDDALGRYLRECEVEWMGDRSGAARSLILEGSTSIPSPGNGQLDPDARLSATRAETR